MCLPFFACALTRTAGAWSLYIGQHTGDGSDALADLEDSGESCRAGIVEPCANSRWFATPPKKCLANERRQTLGALEMFENFFFRSWACAQYFLCFQTFYQGAFQAK